MPSHSSRRKNTCFIVTTPTVEPRQADQVGHDELAQCHVLRQQQGLDGQPLSPENLRRMGPQRCHGACHLHVCAQIAPLPTVAAKERLRTGAAGVGGVASDMLR